MAKPISIRRTLVVEDLIVRRYVYIYIYIHIYIWRERERVRQREEGRERDIFSM